MSSNKRENLKWIYISIISSLLFLILTPSFSCAQPLPPSKHILSYEEFVSSNDYAGDFVSVNAKVDRIEWGKDINWYRISLLSLEGEELPNKGWVRVNHSVGFEIFKGRMLTRDENIGIAIDKGDNIVIVGKAGKIVGMNRLIHVNEEGTVILLLSEEEYKREGSIRGGKKIRDFSFSFNVVESYKLVNGNLIMDKKVLTKKFFAIGDYDFSLLAGNYQLLDRDGDKLMCPLDHFPDTKDKDNDGLDDKEEMEFRTWAGVKDSDEDRLGDYEEVKGIKGYVTDPTSMDTDGDDLNDYKEIHGFERGGKTYTTNPLKRDTDGDRLIDSVDLMPQTPLLPDLAITSASVVAITEDLLQVSHTVKNVGKVDVESFNVKNYSSTSPKGAGERLASDSFSSLSSNSSLSESVTIDLPSMSLPVPGYIIVYVDFENQIPEVNENNNSKSVMTDIFRRNFVEDFSTIVTIIVSVYIAIWLLIIFRKK